MRADPTVVADGQARSGGRRGADGRGDRLRELGSEIAALRTERGLSMVGLAKRAGVSPSLISQVERGVTAPSLGVLWGIARALDVSIGAFFQDTESPPELPAAIAQGHPASPSGKATVVRAGARKLLGLPNSITYELLSPDLNRQIEFIWVRFEPGEESPLEPYVHPGEEQMVVIQGEMHYVVDGEEYVLGEGDAITFDSALPHRALNRGQRPAVVVAAITPPSF